MSMVVIALQTMYVILSAYYKIKFIKAKRDFCVVLITDSDFNEHRQRCKYVLHYASAICKLKDRVFNTYLVPTSFIPANKETIILCLSNYRSGRVKRCRALQTHWTGMRPSTCSSSRLKKLGTAEMWSNPIAHI